MKLFVVASLAVLAISPAFAQSAPKVVKAKAVAITDTGRTIVRADGSMFIELQSSEIAKLDAQTIYQMNDKIKLAIRADQAAADRKNRTYDMKERAGIYRNTNSNLPYESFYGVSVPDLGIVRGDKYEQTREQRLTYPTQSNSYIIAKTEKQQGVVGTVECRNSQGKRDVYYNAGRSSCAPTIRIFRKLNL